MGVGSVKNRIEPAGKAAVSPAHLAGADGWGANRGPVPAQAGQPSIAGDRSCKLLFESTGGIAADVDADVVRRTSRPRQGGVAGHLLDSNDGA